MTREGDAGLLRTATASVALCWLAMVAYPLAQRRGQARRLLTPVVVGSLAVTTSAVVVRRWGVRRGAIAAVVVSLSTALVERIGTSTGVPFGRYRYTDRLRPAVAGVPVVVPLAWWAMAAPSREVAHAVLGRRSTPWARVAVGAFALTAWDLFLDPQMVAEDFWRWRRAGRYRGIPATNFAGWLLTGVAVMAVLERMLPARPQPDAGLVAEYAAMGAMETVGFAAFFRDPLVAATGGAAMLPIGVRALARTLRMSDD